jgi:peptidase E
MQPTALIYSSHDRCEYLHRTFIVERALQSPDNKTILYLPISMRERHQQDYGYGTFSWYFRRFEQYGLKHSAFFWSPELRKQDAEVLFDKLLNDQVVILGGGNSELGIWRYRTLGEHFFGDRNLFERILHEREKRGMLTVGFSAGADQLCELLTSAIEEDDPDLVGFGLAHNVMTTLHHERGREYDLQVGARKFPQIMFFGLPNDSGLAVNQGKLPSGNWWQIIDFVIDNSWDIPKDSWHIKTRMGMKIEHIYADGRSWQFMGGERMIRIMSPDGRWQDAWMQCHGRPFLHYGTQLPTFHRGIEDIFRAH